MTESARSTGHTKAGWRPIKPLPTGESTFRSPPLTPSRLSTPRQIPPVPRKILDFDLETVAAGFADPDWVPQTITAWAASWVGDDWVESGFLEVAHFYSPENQRLFLKPLLELVALADVLTGHNIRRFDLPVLNAQCMRVGLPDLGSVMTQDTIRVPKSKGFKKGQDNMAVLLDVPLPKRSLNWQEWHEAYNEPDHETVRDRVVGDVKQHKQLRERMMEKGWLESPRCWNSR